MKKTSLMQKTHSLFSSKAWRNGLALLLLLCFVGTTEVSAQSLNTGMSSVYVPTTDAVKTLGQEVATLETTVKAVTMADKMQRKFYYDVQANIQNGMSVEDALEASRTKMIQYAAQLGSFTIQDVDNVYNSIDDFLRI